MNLNDFMSHMKHKSLSIKIEKLIPNEELGLTTKLLYDGDVGTYGTTVIKSQIGNEKIFVINPEDNLLIIILCQ